MSDRLRDLDFMEVQRVAHVLAKGVENKALDILTNLDLQILDDLCDNAEFKGERTHFGEGTHTCYYAGWPQELAAGIWGGSASPAFDTPDELYRWVVENEADLIAEFDWE